MATSIRLCGCKCQNRAKNLLMAWTELGASEKATGSEKTKLGLCVKPDVKQAHDTACRDNVSEGFLGAAIIWIGLPADIREAAMSHGKNLPVADAVAITRKALMTRMTDLAMEEGVRAMPKAEKKKFIRETRDRSRPK